MTKTVATMAAWAPRLAGLGLALFLSLFAFDAFNGKSFADGFPGFLIHLAPALLVAVVLAAAWRFPAFGAVAFAILALSYAVTVRARLDWVAAISGPLVIVAVLFLVSWRHSSHAR